jgi:thiol-disulfide isomerase/thioredoxin
LDGVWPWFNVPEGPGLLLDGLLGAVVVVEFWTYVCGNCTRTVPFLRDLYDEHARADLQIVAVHTPELAVDRRARNVAAAVATLGIRYPVGMDNEYAAWNRWGVGAWPTLFLLDRAGRIRRRHVGEGGTRELRRCVAQLAAEQ